MADSKISNLPAATTPLAGTEVLPIVQSGATKKVATDDLTVKNLRSNATTGILQVTGPAAASTRVMTVPNANFTAARIDAEQTFTGTQTFSADAIVNTLTVGLGTGAVTTNTAVGAGVLSVASTGLDVVALGYWAGRNNTGSANTFVGKFAGRDHSSGNNNTFVGCPNTQPTPGSAGSFMYTGSGNTFIGGFDGFADGTFDIRYLSNYCVLSGGAGIPRAWQVDTSGWYQSNNSASWSVTSDMRIKENVVDLSCALEQILKLRPVEFDFIETKQHMAGFIAQEYGTVFADQITTHAPHSALVNSLTGGEDVQAIQQNLVPYLVSAIQELSAKFDAYAVAHP